jgi:hypothetical protein
MKRITLISIVALITPAISHAGPVKIYGTVAQADLTVLTAATSSFSVTVCSIASNVCSPGGSLSWTINDDHGNVANPGGGKMDAQGWLTADQYIKISSVTVNTPGWALDIYTNNVSTSSNPRYAGPLVDQGSVNGLVSMDISASTGTVVIPLAWKVSQSTFSFAVHPVPQEDTTAPYTCPKSTDNLTSLPRTTAGFCDFATHYMSDLGDYSLDPYTPFIFPKPSWWQKIDYDSAFNAAQKNYQSILTSDGAAIGDYYRSPYSTLTGIGNYYLYIFAKFVPAIRTTYKTTVYLEIAYS